MVWKWSSKFHKKKINTFGGKNENFDEMLSKRVIHRDCQKLVVTYSKRGSLGESKTKKKRGGSQRMWAGWRKVSMWPSIPSPILKWVTFSSIAPTSPSLSHMESTYLMSGCSFFTATLCLLNTALYTTPMVPLPISPLNCNSLNLIIWISSILNPDLEALSVR